MSAVSSTNADDHLPCWLFVSTVTEARLESTSEGRAGAEFKARFLPTRGNNLGGVLRFSFGLCSVLIDAILILPLSLLVSGGRSALRQTSDSLIVVRSRFSRKLHQRYRTT